MMPVAAAESASTESTTENTATKTATVPGDMNSAGEVNTDDAIYLLRHVLMPSKYPISQSGDANGDNEVNTDDAIYLLRHVLMPSKYPLLSECEHSVVTDAGVAPTCTEKGLSEGSHCSKCGEVFVAQQVLSAKGHTVVTIPAVSPTCTQLGKTEGSLCTVCNTILIQQTDIPTIGHDYVSGKCTMCGDKEDKTPLEVTSVTPDKSFVMANEVVTFYAAANKSDVTLTGIIYLDGVEVAQISGVEDLKYIPTTAGRYDAEISVTEDGVNVFTYYLKSAFDVKSYWSLNDVTTTANSISLGKKITFNANIDGNVDELNYALTVYKDGVDYYSTNGSNSLDFYPNVTGIYYGVFTVTDKYGEKQSAQSENITVNVQTDANPILSVNYGTTLNIDELDGSDGDDIVVPYGQDIKFVWNKEDTDSYYKIRISTPQNSTDDFGISQNKYKSNSYTLKSNKIVSGSEYRVEVKKYNSSGKETSKLIVNFTVSGAKSILLENRLEVLSPVKNGIYAQNDIMVQWTKLNYASKYVLSLEYDCGKDEHTLIECVEISNTQNTYTIPESYLRQGCDHIVTISAYDSLGNEISENIVFRIEGDSAIFELDKPEITDEYFYEKWTDDMKSYPVYEDVLVTWSDVPAASYYSITIDSHYSEIDDPVLLNTNNIKDNYYTIPVSALASGCVYSIRISAYCSEGHKLTSDRGYFRVPYKDGATLTGPEVISHEFSKDEDEPICMVEQPLTIIWAPVSAAKTYNVYWAEKDHENNPEYEIKGLTKNSVTIPNDCIYTSSSNGYTDFRLKIVAEDENGLIENAYYYIRLMKSNVESPTIVSPNLPTEDDVSLPSFDDDFTITWNPVEGAVSYRVRVYEYYDDGYNEYYTQEGITSTSFEIPIEELYGGGQFKLTVRAYDQYGNGNGSNYYFVVGNADYIGLSEYNWNPSYKADHEYPYVMTSGDWTAETSVSWITLSHTSGLGSKQVKVSVTENTGSEARIGSVTFKNSNGGIAIFSISQSPKEAPDTGVIKITSPSQGEVVDKDVLMVTWGVKYSFGYFELDLFDLTDNKTVYHKSSITYLYHQIPASYIKQGHSYQLILSVFDYSNNKNAETSIVFKADGEILPDDEQGDEETINTYTVTFIDYDGTILRKQSGILKGNAATAPTVPNRDGYSFTGWDKPFNNITSDLTVTATYNQIEPTECIHTNKIFVNYIYEDITYINSTSHSVRVISRYECRGCYQFLTDYSNGIVKTEAHVQDFVVNDGWVCRCGHIEGVSFESYQAHLQSDVNQPTYYDAALTINYGTVYVTDEITVIGESGEAYLIKYPLDAGGYKFAFIAKKYIDTQTYNKNSKFFVFVNGDSVSAVNNNEKVYVDLNELLSAIGTEDAEIRSQTGYSIIVGLRNTKNKEFYMLSIDLSDYKNHNWANIYAKKYAGGETVSGFCVGAYVYTDNIYIELQELMDLLEYQCEDNCYVPSDYTVNLKLYANALNIADGGIQFDTLYESLKSEMDGRIRSILYHLFTLDWGDMISSNDYYTDEELVKAIKQMLYTRNYPVDTSKLNIDYGIMESLGGLFSMVESGMDATAMTMGEWEYRFAAILRDDGFGDVFGNLKLACNNFSENAEAIGSVIEIADFEALLIDEVTLMTTLQFQYEENITVLNSLIKNETNQNVISVYEKVKNELMSYYASQAQGVLKTLSSNREIRDTVVGGLIDWATEEAKEGFLQKTALSNPYYVAYEITCFFANEVFNGEELYDAQDGLYRMHNTLTLYVPSLESAIIDYYESPTKANLDRVISTAIVTANLRIQASDYCIDYVGSKIFNNDTEAYEIEKGNLEHYLKIIKDILITS